MKTFVFRVRMVLADTATVNFFSAQAETQEEAETKIKKFLTDFAGHIEKCDFQFLNEHPTIN